MNVPPKIEFFLNIFDVQNFLDEQISFSKAVPLRLRKDRTLSSKREILFVKRIVSEDFFIYCVVYFFDKQNLQELLRLDFCFVLLSILLKVFGV